MTDGSGTSPCFLFYHQYDDYEPAYDTSRFTIHCTLEKGAEAYYSGVRVIVIVDNIVYDDKFAKVKIHQVMWVGGKRVEIEPSKDTNEVIDDHALSVDGLPLYTLILELVDLSDGIRSHAGIIYQAPAESFSPGPIPGPIQQIPDTHKVLYEYAQCTTVHSPSCVLFLATRDIELWRLLKPADLARVGLPTHGFRILPPSERRPFFTQPPPEILHHIFSILTRDSGYHDNWRGGLVAASLVCRAWWKAALCIIYEDFERGSQTKLHIGRIAAVLEDNPTWGRHIKRFSPYCFTNTNTEVQLTRDALTILKTASDMRRLSVGHIDAVLAGEFVETFCKMTEIREFTQFLMSPPRRDINYSEEKIYLNAAQLTKCFVYWPKLRRVMVHWFGKPHAGDGSEFAPAQCTLDEISFEHGFLSIAQLRAITASSRGTLHTVVLRYIEGISNMEFTSWLKDFGPNLTRLTLECKNVFTRSEADELALDATIQKMSKLSYLNIEGPVATVLSLLRFNPTQELEGRIRILSPVLFDLHAFVKALRTTKWEIVNVEGLVMPGEGPAELIKEAERVAEERGIDLWMQY